MWSIFTVSSLLIEGREAHQAAPELTEFLHCRTESVLLRSIVCRSSRNTLVSYVIKRRGLGVKTGFAGKPSLGSALSIKVRLGVGAAVVDPSVMTMSVFHSFMAEGVGLVVVVGNGDVVGTSVGEAERTIWLSESSESTVCGLDVFVSWLSRIPNRITAPVRRMVRIASPEVR